MENTAQSYEVILLIAAGIGVMLLLVFAFILFFNFSQKKLQNEKLKTQQLQIEQQQKLLYSNLQTQEKERKRIAKDLHDEVGSKLNVLFLSLHRLKKSVARRPESEEIVGEIFGVINDTIDTTRRISHDLLPPTLENFGLHSALVELCENYQKTGQVEVKLEASNGEAPSLDKSVELNLFRIVQELISNSIKHGRARHIGIQLNTGPRGTRIEYRDNGLGFDPRDPLHQNGLGMQNIESRMKMIGGSFTIDSEPGKGVSASILLTRKRSAST